MSLYTYAYSILGDFPNQIYSESSLYSEVLNSTITVALHSIEADFNNVYFNFKAALSPTEVTTLNTIVANHTGAELVPVATVNQGTSGSLPWKIDLEQTSTIQQITGSVSVSNPLSNVSIINFPAVQQVTGSLSTTVTFPPVQTVTVSNPLSNVW